MRRARAALLVFAALLGACSSSIQPDDAAIVRDFQTHRSYVEVTADGTVVRVLPDRTGPSGPHEQFLIQLSTGDLTVLVEHNLTIGARVPVSVGDHVIVHGEYIWNSDGGLIHFTHHDPVGKHQGGYIEENGKRYD